MTPRPNPEALFVFVKKASTRWAGPGIDIPGSLPKVVRPEGKNFRLVCLGMACEKTDRNGL